MLRELFITKFASINHPIKLKFGRNNLILGKNATGKTAICDSIKCLFEYDTIFLKDFAKFSGGLVSIQSKNIIKNNININLERIIRLESKKIINDILKINGKETNDYDALSSILKVIYVTERVIRQINDDRSFAKFCYSYLANWSKGLTKQHFFSLQALSDRYNSLPNRMFEQIDWQANGKIFVKQWDSAFLNKSYSTLSGGERCIFLADISILLGQQFSEFRPTLVILDDVLTHLDDKHMYKIRDRINAIANPNLQFLFTTWIPKAETIIKPDCIIRLERKKLESGMSTSVSDVILKTPFEILAYERKIKQFKSGNEDSFINSVVIPLLYKMGFSTISRIHHHGLGELGVDVGPFTGSGFEWRNSFCGVQAKAVKLNATSGSSNNINVLIDEVKKALNNKFYDSVNSFYSKLDYVLIFLSQYPTPEALKTINDTFEGDRRVILLDPMRIAELIWKYGVALY